MLLISVETVREENSSVDEALTSRHAFCAWDCFHDSNFPLLPVSIVTINGVKSAYELVYSNHHPPRLTPNREMRTTDKSDAVQCFVLGCRYGDAHIMSSVEEFVTFAADFFSSSVCNGLPFDPDTNNEKKIVTGYKNTLNHWQSNDCAFKIGAPGWEFCLHCEKLRRCLVKRKFR